METEDQAEKPTDEDVDEFDSDSVSVNSEIGAIIGDGSDDSRSGTSSRMSMDFDMGQPKVRILYWISLNLILIENFRSAAIDFGFQITNRSNQTKEDEKFRGLRDTRRKGKVGFDDGGVFLLL